MSEAYSAISRNRKMCTGVALTAESPDMNPKVNSQDAFDSLVSDYSSLLREALAADVGFLMEVERSARVRKCERSVYLLRTAKQHHDNSEATKFYREWEEATQSWQVAADALAKLLEDALADLARVSGRVRRDAALTAAWRDRVSIEPAAVFSSVCADLRVTFSPVHTGVLVRQIEKRARRIKPGQDLRAELEAICADEATNQGKRLPVPYHQVLDRLGVLGQQRARSALLLAYSIAGATSLRGEQFLARVEETWKAANGG